MKWLLLIICALLLATWLKNKLALHVATLWMVENDVPQPTSEDVRRLTSKLVRRWFHQD